MLCAQCLLYAVNGGVTLRNPPTLYSSLKEFALAHTAKLRYPRMAVWGDLRVQAEARAKGQQLEPANGLSASSSAAQPQDSLFQGSSVAASPAPGSAKDADEKEDDNTCIVCWSVQIDTVFIPCGHMACCQACANNLSPQICVVCRVPIQQVVKVFRAAS